MSERPTTPSKYEGFGAAMAVVAAKLMIGISFGMGVI